MIKKNKIKTLLLQIPDNLDNVHDSDSISQPYGLAVISSFLKSNGCDIVLYDANALHIEKERLIKYIVDLAPDIIALTLYSVQLHQTIHFLTEIKKRLPYVRTVVGGPHPSSDECKNLLVQNNVIDLAVRGEGEYTLLELINAIESGSSFGDIKGLVFRENREVKVNDTREFIKDLDSLPMADWDSLPMDNYWGVSSEKKNLVNILFSRGCKSSCTFCASKVALGKSIRKRSPDSIINEIKYLYENHHVRELAMNDATFNFDFDWNKEIAERLLEYNKPGLVWGCNLRADMTVKMDMDLLRLMKKSGLRNIFMGIESGDDAILKRMKKGTNVEMIRKALRMLDEVGIKVYCGFILGMPGETEESLKRTIAFAKEIRKYSTAFSIATPFPGTELYEQAKKEGFYVENWARLDYHGITYVPQGLTKETLHSYYTRNLLSYYLSLPFLITQVLQIKSWLQFKKSFRLGYRILVGRRRRLLQDISQ